MSAAPPYPICLNIRGRRCVVVGGGRVAERKARGLLAAGADVTVIAREAGSGLKRLARGRKIGVLRRGFLSSDLKAAFIVMAATDDAAVNTRVASEARRRGALVNVADSPWLCDFFLPAVVRRGDLQIAISTAGSSPALAKRIRKELSGRYREEYGTLLHIASALRPDVMRIVPPRARAAVFAEMTGPAVVRLLRRGRTAAARRRMLKAIADAAPARNV
jgi:siroheme synthase-like protein